MYREAQRKVHYHRVDVIGAWARVFDRPTRSATFSD
jgi:hypothetical protein